MSFIICSLLFCSICGQSNNQHLIMPWTPAFLYSLTQSAVIMRDQYYYLKSLIRMGSPGGKIYNSDRLTVNKIETHHAFSSRMLHLVWFCWLLQLLIGKYQLLTSKFCTISCLQTEHRNHNWAYKCQSLPTTNISAGPHWISLCIGLIPWRTRPGPCFNIR